MAGDLNPRFSGFFLSPENLFSGERKPLLLVCFFWVWEDEASVFEADFQRL